MPNFRYEQDIKNRLDQRIECAIPIQENLFTPNPLRQALDSQKLIVGVDEAGCGPWAGPVVAGAVIFFDHDHLPNTLEGLLNDSKQMTDKQRQTAFSILTGQSSKVLASSDGPKTSTTISFLSPDAKQWVGAIGIGSVHDIDTLNIRQATLLAMKRAVEGLPIKPHFALVDGISKPDLDCGIQTIKKGDSLSYSIAAASILAKVYRDYIMQSLATDYPGYGWQTNVGYGTKGHQDGLDTFGITPHHRTSFRPISERLSTQIKSREA